MSINFLELWQDAPEEATHYSVLTGRFYARLEDAWRYYWGGDWRTSRIGESGVAMRYMTRPDWAAIGRKLRGNKIILDVRGMPQEVIEALYGGSLPRRGINFLYFGDGREVGYGTLSRVAERSEDPILDWKEVFVYEEPSQ